jgi:hypothetical protein
MVIGVLMKSDRYSPLYTGKGKDFSDISIRGENNHFYRDFSGTNISI